MLKERLYVQKLCKFNARILLSLFLTLSFTTIAIAQQCMANCKGDTSIGGPCYAGIGGPAYAGIGGGAYLHPHFHKTSSEQVQREVMS